MSSFWWKMSKIWIFEYSSVNIKRAALYFASVEDSDTYLHKKTGIDRDIIWTRTSKKSCRSLSRGLRVKKWAQSDKKWSSYEFSRETTLKFEFTGSTPSFCEINQKRRSSEYRSNSESKERLKIAKFVILRFENGRDTIKIDRVMIFASLRIRRNASRKFFSFFNF